MLCLSTLAIVATDARTLAKENPVGCRAGIARSMRRMAGTGMRTIDTCHHDRNRGGADGACNALPEGGLNDWTRQATRTAQFLQFRCPTGVGAISDNYPPCHETGCNNVTVTTVSGTTDLLEANATVLLSDEPLDGAAARCQEAIGKARRRIARRLLQRAQECQDRLDRRRGNSEFGPLADECVPTGGDAPRERSSIVRACDGLTGTDVGSCDPLPECVIGAAQTLGRELAVLTYGEPVTCGDGNIEVGEDCDDGNSDPTDACTDTCQNARCGDEIVWEGVEECDDGNDIATDACDACHLPVCGDGVRAGTEECDDGNNTPDDGCTSCTIDPVLCGAGGIRATITYADPKSTNAAAGRMLLAYPGAVSLPGTGSAGSVRLRLTNLSGTSNPIFLPSDTDTNGDTVDDSLVLVFGTTVPWPQGPFAAIVFDCSAGTPVRSPDFNCSFNDASDPFSNAVDPTALVCSVTALEPIP